MYRGFFFNWNLKVSISAVVAFLMSSRMDSHFLKDSTNYVQVLFPTDHSILFSCSFCWRVSHYGVVFEKLIVRWRESNFLFKSCFSWKIKFRKILDWLSFMCIKWDLNSICMKNIRKLEVISPHLLEYYLIIAKLGPNYILCMFIFFFHHFFKKIYFKNKKLYFK